MFLLKKVLSSDFVRFEKESGPGFSPSFTSSTEKHATFTRRQNYLTRDIDLRVDSSTALLSAQNLIDFLCTDYVYVHSQELMADGDSFSRSQTAHASSIGNGDLTHKKNLMLDLALDLFFIKAILITAVHLVSVEQGKQLSVRSFGPLEQTQLIARISELGGVIQVSSHPVSSEETGSLYRDKVISRLGTLIKEYSFLSLLTRHINIPDEFLDMPVTDYLNAHFYKYQLVEDFDRFSKHETASYEIHSVDTFGLSLSFYVHPYFEDLDPSLITSMIDVIHGVENASRRLVTELPNFTETLGLSSGQNINHDALSPQMVCTVGRTSLSYGGAYAGHMGLYKDGLMQDRLSCIQDSTCVGDGVGGATGSEYIAFILSQCFSCYSGIYKQTNLTHVLRETQHIWEHSKKGLTGQTALSVSSIQKLGPLRQVTFQQIGDCNAYLVKRHVDTNEFQVLLTTKDNCFGIVDAITESLFPEQEFKEYCGKRHYMDRSFHSGSDPSQFNESYLKYLLFYVNL